MGELRSRYQLSPDLYERLDRGHVYIGTLEYYRWAGLWRQLERLLGERTLLDANPQDALTAVQQLYGRICATGEYRRFLAHVAEDEPDIVRDGVFPLVFAVDMPLDETGAVDLAALHEIIMAVVGTRAATRPTARQVEALRRYYLARDTRETDVAYALGITQQGVSKLLYKGYRRLCEGLALTVLGETLLAFEAADEVWAQEQRATRRDEPQPRRMTTEESRGLATLLESCTDRSPRTLRQTISLMAQGMAANSPATASDLETAALEKLCATVDRIFADDVDNPRAFARTVAGNAMKDRLEQIRTQARRRRGDDPEDERIALPDGSGNPDSGNYSGGPGAGGSFWSVSHREKELPGPQHETPIGAKKFSEILRLEALNGGCAEAGPPSSTVRIHEHELRSPTSDPLPTSGFRFANAAKIT